MFVLSEPLIKPKLLRDFEIVKCVSIFESPFFFIKTEKNNMLLL